MLQEAFEVRVHVEAVARAGAVSGQQQCREGSVRPGQQPLWRVRLEVRVPQAPEVFQVPLPRKRLHGAGPEGGTEGCGDSDGWAADRRTGGQPFTGHGKGPPLASGLHLEALLELLHSPAVAQYPLPPGCCVLALEEWRVGAQVVVCTGGAGAGNIACSCTATS